MLDRLLYQDSSLPVLEKAMDAYALRHKAIASNVANINTEGYRRKEVKFEEQLQYALDKERIQGTKTDPDHMDLGRPEIEAVKAQAFVPDDPTTPSGVNNVDIDDEMVQLTNNQLRFYFASKLAGINFNMIRSAIKGK
ncbi:MAG: flagellar basal body rod protein FlgB [Candidatus Delongbacteria bacterium]|nr:flagellar basal body rod protein FlgB [Candidatus Delongbacteria bacterium]